MRLSKTYDDFSIELDTVLDYIGFHNVRLGVTAIQINSLALAHAAWNAEYKLYIDPERQTSIQIKTTRDNFKKARNLVNEIQQQIKHNKAITLTDTDRIKLYIHTNVKRRTRIPAPTVAPNNVLIISEPLSNRISVVEPIPEGENRLGLPPDVSQIGRKIALMPQGGIEPKASDYQNINAVGSRLFTIEWQPEQSGQMCYLITWFMNNRGENGPESLPLMIPII